MERCCKAIEGAQRQLWKLKWDNTFKEVYWRLVVNGLATAERMHMHDCVCVCGPVVDGQLDRQHHFWTCPVAQAVVDVLQHQLGGWFPSALQPQHVLCMLCPAPVGVATTRVLHKGVWRVVCLAAINAMDMGRKAAMKIQVDQHEQQQQQQQAAQQQPPVPAGQRLITDMLQPAALTADQQQHQAQVRQHQLLQLQQQQQQQHQIVAARLAEVKQQAAGRFWELLQDFIALQAAPRSWLTQVASDHPFLRVTDNRLCVHCVAATPDVG
jgi:hypothetical protein